MIEPAPFFIDIETQRSGDQDVIAKAMASVKPPGNYKKPETITEWWEKEGNAARIEAANRTALDGTYGRLATIGVAFGGHKPVVFGGPGVAERDLLGLLNDYLSINAVASTGFVAFNGDFDFRFLYQRYVINGMKPALFPHRKNGYFDYYDPMREWAGPKGYIKQTELEYALGIPRLDPLEGDGSRVAEAIDVGDWGKVIEHNFADICGLQQIYNRMTA
jgi:uncharacterized protein YprB with RNaseH-like and TPR domain